ncbi:MAG: hypothetical protein QOI83_268, partial [Streptomycetaceae bacterium]|nr:hypothetical protein [Streptomycetaceae bacterium]
GPADPVYLTLPTALPPSPRLPADMPPELAELLGGVLSEPEADLEAEERARQTRAELSAGPVELIRLTDLGTEAVRQRLLAAGRDAPLVGELVQAPATGLLGVIAEHYDPDSARAELALWTAAHGGPNAARSELVRAVCEMPFRTRAEAMLDALAAALPEGEGEALLHSLRGDRSVAPTALSVLVRREALGPDDLVDAEAPLMVAESLLQLLESAGEEAVVQALLGAGHGQAQEALDAALASGHPDQDGLESLRRLGAGPLRSRSAQLGRLGAARARRGRTRPGRRR